MGLHTGVAAEGGALRPDRRSRTREPLESPAGQSDSLSLRRTSCPSQSLLSHLGEALGKEGGWGEEAR